MSAPAVPGSVTVHEVGYVAYEPVLGAARYPDGSLIVVAHRTPPWAPDLPGPITYRTRGSASCWHVVWAMPRKLQDFITTQPVGTLGKASNRRVEIVDFATVVPEGRITIAHGCHDNWVGY